MAFILSTFLEQAERFTDDFAGREIEAAFDFCVNDLLELWCQRNVHPSYLDQKPQCSVQICNDTRDDKLCQSSLSLSRGETQLRRVRETSRWGHPHVVCLGLHEAQSSANEGAAWVPPLRPCASKLDARACSRSCHESPHRYLKNGG